MKEGFCKLFNLTNPVAAFACWKRWFDAAEASGIPALVKFAELKRPRLDGLVAHAFREEPRKKLSIEPLQSTVNSFF